MENRDRNNRNNRWNEEYDDSRNDWQSGYSNDDRSSNYRNNMNRDDDWNNRGFGEQRWSALYPSPNRRQRLTTVQR